MNKADLVILIVFTISFLIGWHKGFLKTILGPIALFLGTALAFFVHEHGMSFAITCSVGFFGPFLIRIVLGIILKMFTKIFKEEDAKHSPISKFLGGCCKLIWSGGLFLIFTLLLTMLPFKIQSIQVVQETIRTSKTFALLNSFLKKGDDDPIEVLSNISKSINDPKTKRKLRNKESYKDLMSTDSVRELFKDPITLKQLEEKDIANLITNPKVQELMKEPDLLKKLFAFQKDLLAEDSDE